MRTAAGTPKAPKERPTWEKTDGQKQPPRRSKQKKAEQFQKRPIEHLPWLVSVSSKKLVESASLGFLYTSLPKLKLWRALYMTRINPQVSNWMLAKKELSIGFLSAKVTVFPDQFHCGSCARVSEMIPYIFSTYTLYIYIIHVNVSNYIHIFNYNLSKPTVILISGTQCEKRVSMRDCHATEVVSAAPAKGRRFREETGPNSR